MAPYSTSASARCTTSRYGDTAVLSAKKPEDTMNHPATPCNAPINPRSFDEIKAFTARWQEATTEQGGFQTAIVDRVLNDLFGSFKDVKASGLGTGFSTNVGQKTLTKLGFGASEGEWGRLLYDNGFVLGSLLIGYRIAIAFSIVFAAFRAWRRRSTSSLLFASACFVIVLNGQWGQTTTLGAGIIGGGLTLAAASNRRLSSPKKPHRHIDLQNKPISRMAAPDNIIVYRLGSLGDTVVALPCFRLIRKVYPRSKITLLTNQPVNGKAAPAMAILENSGLCDEAVSYPVGTRNVAELAKVRQTIRQIHPRVLINLAAGRVVKSLRDYFFFRSCGVKDIVGTPLRRRDLQVQRTNTADLNRNRNGWQRGWPRLGSSIWRTRGFGIWD